MTRLTLHTAESAPEASRPWVNRAQSANGFLPNLIGVLAIVFFSLVELPRSSSGRGALLITLLLSVVTIVVNSIALLAILYRISNWGFTPNRLAVLGANLLFFIHLILIAVQLVRQVRSKEVEFAAIEKTIAVFLPFYAGWALFVAVVVPLIFSFS